MAAAVCATTIMLAKDSSSASCACALRQVAYLIIYGALPSAKELARWDEALMRHSAVPVAVERAVAALPHDAHFMGIVLTALNALSTVHPEQNPALAGQSVYDSREIQDKQIVRIIGAARQRDGARPAFVGAPWFGTLSVPRVVRVSGCCPIMQPEVTGTCLHRSS